jgi:hypothetical protein
MVPGAFVGNAKLGGYYTLPSIVQSEGRAHLRLAVGFSIWTERRRVESLFSVSNSKPTITFKTFHLPMT